MSILAIFSSNEITQEVYEALRKEIGWETNQPPGAMFHAAGLDDSGHVHVADVWESAEALKAFVDYRLLPTLQRLHIAPPSVQIYPAFNINAFPAVEKFVLR